MRAKLEIIITHCRESWDVCSKMFQMLDVQRGMVNGECRVTVVQDGSDGALDTSALMKRFPFITSVITLPHGGVSAARNAGIEAADAEFVMLCDCDDMLYSCDSLRRILDGIADAQGRADLIWAPIVIESRTEDGFWFTMKKEWNCVFIHGKCWRLEWLRENRLRFREEIVYSEDSLFCAEAALVLDPKRIGKIPSPVYMWCLRSGSCTSDLKNAARNREHLAKHRIMMPQICMDRGRPEEARTHAARAIFDCWHEFTSGTVTGPELDRLEEMITKGLIIPWYGEAMKADPEDLTQLMEVSRKSSKRKKQYKEDAEPLEEWIRRLKTKYGEV